MALAKHPWLIDLVDKRERRAAHRHADHGTVLDKDLVAQAANAASSSTDPQVEDVVVGLPEEHVFEVLRQRRDAWMADHAAPDEVHVTSLVRGGIWTASHTGSVVEPIRAQASSSTAQDFRRLHGLAQGGTFSLRLYGEEACALLVASLWVARITFLLEPRLKADTLSARIPSASLAESEPRPCAAGLLTRGAAASRRAHGILQLAPAYIRQRRACSRSVGLNSSGRSGRSVGGKSGGSIE